MDDRERLLTLAKHYNTELEAEFYTRTTPPENLRDRIISKVKDFEYLAAFSSLKQFSPVSNHRALDVGCSGGRYTLALLGLGADAIGLDTGMNILTYARRRSQQGVFVCASVTDLPFERESFDLVLCIGLLHHLSDDTTKKALAEISSITKPGGIFIFDIRNRLNPFIWYIYKHKMWAKGELLMNTRTTTHMEHLVYSCGFKVINRKGILFPISYLAPFVMLTARKLGRDE
ncbi:class I SAM-dependent methyltransferase [Chloroflexota bacterium]